MGLTKPSVMGLTKHYYTAEVETSMPRGGHDALLNEVLPKVFLRRYEPVDKIIIPADYVVSKTFVV
jgi:hypothetical protein